MAKRSAERVNQRGESGEIVGQRTIVDVAWFGQYASPAMSRLRRGDRVRVNTGGAWIDGAIEDVDRWNRGWGVLVRFRNGTAQWMIPGGSTRILRVEDSPGLFEGLDDGIEV